MKAEKSTGAAVLLAIFFGALGLLYANFLAGCVMIVLHVAGWIWAVSGIAEFLFSGLIQAALWIADVILAVVFVGRHNREVAAMKERAAEVRHQEQLAAIQRGGAQT